MGPLSDANLARLRENQRRSRARRKEYVNSIERQLRDRQRQGIEVTGEIQQAARRVAEDNKKMRSLLNILGFNDETVNHFLYTGNIDPAKNINPNISYGQDNTIQMLEQLLATRYLTTPASGFRTAPSIANTSVCDKISDNTIAPILNNQTEADNTITTLNEHSELHKSTSLQSSVLISGAQGCPQYAISEASQQSPDPYRPSNEDQHVQAFPYDADFSCQDVMYHEHHTNMQQPAGEYAVVDLHASLPCASKMASYSLASAGDAFSAPLQRGSGPFDDVVNQHSDWMSDIGLFPNIICSSPSSNTPSYVKCASEMVDDRVFY